MRKTTRSKPNSQSHCRQPPHGEALTAITEGYGVGDFEAIALTHSPCGGCRQWLWEFRIDRVVFRNQGNVLTMTPGELLPETFDDL